MNNLVCDGVQGINFFEQANDFATSHNGPKLANTRQLEFIEPNNEKLNGARSESNLRSFRTLCPAVVKQMAHVMTRIRETERCIESEELLEDNFIASFPILEGKL